MLVLLSNATGGGVRGVVATVDAVAGTITLTAKEVNAPTVFAVNEGPALIELDGTSVCRINLVAGEYS